MTSPSEYYEENLYPLQDGVLSTLSKCDARFYLTGGTALSRAYYHHRYSDDLDFFTLSNKLGAIFRFAAKDIADVREIARHEDFLWSDIISEAREKDSSVETEIIAEIIGSFPKPEFEKIKWREPAPSWEKFSADIQIIVDDMVNCRENSLRHKA